MSSAVCEKGWEGKDLHQHRKGEAEMTRPDFQEAQYVHYSSRNKDGAMIFHVLTFHECRSKHTAFKYQIIKFLCVNTNINVRIFKSELETFDSDVNDIKISPVKELLIHYLNTK